MHVPHLKFPVKPKAWEVLPEDPDIVRKAKELLAQRRAEHPHKPQQYLDYYLRPEMRTRSPEDKAETVIKLLRQPQKSKKIIGILIAKGVDVTRVFNGSTLLHSLSSLGYYEAVRYILKIAGGFDVHDARGKTPPKALDDLIAETEKWFAQQRLKGRDNESLAKQIAIHARRRITKSIFDDFARAGAEPRHRPMHENRVREIRARSASAAIARTRQALKDTPDFSTPGKRKEYQESLRSNLAHMRLFAPRVLNEVQKMDSVSRLAKAYGIAHRALKRAEANGTI